MEIDESRDDDRCIPGWRSQFPWMAIDASRDGFLGRRSQHPWMAIDASGMVVDASGGGDRYTTGWRRSIPVWPSMHLEIVIIYPEMAIITSRDGDRCISGWLSMHLG